MQKYCLVLFCILSTEWKWKWIMNVCRQDCSKLEKFEKVACWISISPWWTLELLTELTKITFRFVLYQLSKNLNRSFFMDFLMELRWTILQSISNLVFASVRHATDPVTMDDQDPDSGAWETNLALAAENTSQGTIWCQCCSNLRTQRRSWTMIVLVAISNQQSHKF